MFSVVIPYYKKRKYIERCIDSVLSQTFDDFEIILIDDGSNDDISTVVSKKYGNKVNLIQKENEGVSIARNIGIENASGNYVAFLDADDYWSRFYLEKAYEIVSQNDYVGIIGSHYSSNKKTIQDTNKTINYCKIANYFNIAIINTMFLTSATIVNIDFFRKNSGFNPHLKRGEDIDVWFRIAEWSDKLFYISDTLVYYSNEDVNQATKFVGKTEEALVGVINRLYRNLIKKNRNSDFSRFISKYVYMNLYPYYFDKNNHLEAKKNLEKNKHYYFFLHLPYYLPFFIGETIVQNTKFRKILRNYLKFFTRHIYK